MIGVHFYIPFFILCVSFVYTVDLLMHEEYLKVWLEFLILINIKDQYNYYTTNEAKQYNLYNKPITFILHRKSPAILLHRTQSENNIHYF